MSSTRKKQIPAIQRKKVTASARARVSTSRVRKATKSCLEESFLQNSRPLGVMDDSNQPNLATTPIINNQPDVMIDMLRQLTQSNQSLLERIEKIEQQSANSHQTTVEGGAILQVTTPGLPWGVADTRESATSPNFSAFRQPVCAYSVKYFVYI